MSKQYPRAKYHAGSNPVLVETPEEESALGDGWFDHPSLRDNPVFRENGELAPEPKPTPRRAKPSPSDVLLNAPGITGTESK